MENDNEALQQKMSRLQNNSRRFKLHRFQMTVTGE